jgi:regulator of cell morphogenesis and NO signaling
MIRRREDVIQDDLKIEKLYSVLIKDKILFILVCSYPTQTRDIIMSTFESALSERQVGEIVTENYHSAGIFREYGIDFCCGGGITLKEACQNTGADLQEVSDKLAEIARDNDDNGNDYSEWPAGLLIDYIVQTHHRFVRMKTPEIAAYAEKVARVHGGRHPENVSVFHKFMELGQEMMQHLRSEEEKVFPMIKNIADLREEDAALDTSLTKELGAQLNEMEDEHESAGRLIAEIRELTNGFTPPEDACTTYRILYQNLAGFEEDLHKHVHLENNILFRKAETLLND